LARGERSEKRNLGQDATSYETRFTFQQRCTSLARRQRRAGS
jgi:hypothetical protein